MCPVSELNTWLITFDRRKNYIYQITEDSGRTAYFNSYLGEVLKGIVDDKIPIKGTFAWSLVDNVSILRLYLVQFLLIRYGQFEWNSGLSSESGFRFMEDSL